jgi:Domain of unknown function (DUF6458)
VSARVKRLLSGSINHCKASWAIRLCLPFKWSGTTAGSDVRAVRDARSTSPQEGLGVERQAINRSVALSRHLQAQLEEARAMGIGVGIFLLAVGGVLSFAVSDRISGVDLTAVGYILMGAGIVGLAVALVMNSQRSHTSHTTVEERRDLR